MTPDETGETKIAVIEERLRGTDRALALQAKEYERRLVDLNGEADRIREILAKTVTAEKFDDYVRSQREAQKLALESVTAEIGNLTDAANKLEQRILLIEREERNRGKFTDRHNRWAIAGIGFGLSVLVIVLSILTGNP